MAQRKRSREIRKIEDPQKKQVAFSKRRLTLFKHAQRLHDQTSASVAVIVFSPGGRPYTFGVPSSADSVVDHYLLHLHHHHEEEEEQERQASLVEEEEKREWDWEAWLGEVDDDRCWSLDALATKKDELTEVKKMIDARLSSLNQPSPTSVLDDAVFDGGFEEEEWVDEMIEELLSDPASSTSAPCCPSSTENKGVASETSLVPPTPVLDDAVVDGGGGFEEGEKWVDEMIQELLLDPTSSRSAANCPPDSENNGVVFQTSIVPLPFLF